ncbi:hypothetical protein [Sulfobacillus harzensis]|uniref:Uncharacterized protein n=1 Tax=Sulfobacillus harzensis TaxID=2729629 RepID=A0A7Y0KZZ0_9FIRM|nr:hypothetical protein [Sulfobacillus harzensis]NMP20789.1 hypothetical protein [Sulfobacillus harzensis]
MSDLYLVSPNNPAKAQDLNQVVAALTGANDTPFIAYQPIANPGAPTATVSSATGVLDGAYAYLVVFRTGYVDGFDTIHYSGNQTAAGTASTTVNPADNAVDLTNIPLGPTGVVARDLYRTQAGGSTFYYLDTIEDNVTTDYTDNTPDSGLGTTTAPTVNTTGSPPQLPVYPAVPGYTAPVGSLVAVQAGSGDPAVIYRSTGSGWIQIPDLATANTFTAQQTMLDVAVSGLPGATTPSRYVGGTSGGAPTSGTFQAGDFVVDAASQTLWLCTTAGSPGTWVKASPSAATATAAGIVETAQTVSGTPAVPVIVARPAETELTTTSATTIFSVTPAATGGFFCYLYARVGTAATTVTATLTYTSNSGAQTYYVWNAQDLPVGDNAAVPFFFQAVSGDAITLTVTAGTANQVYIDARLLAV